MLYVGTSIMDHVRGMRLQRSLRRTPTMSRAVEPSPRLIGGSERGVALEVFPLFLQVRKVLGAVDDYNLNYIRQCALVALVYLLVSSLAEDRYPRLLHHLPSNPMCRFT